MTCAALLQHEWPTSAFSRTLSRRVINHVSGHKAGVAGIYNRSTYEPGKQAALKAWANHLAVAIAKAEGANVTPLRKA